MVAHEKCQQHLQEVLHRHILKTTFYVSRENSFLPQVKLLISPEKRSSAFETLCVVLNIFAKEKKRSCKCS